MTSPLGFIEDIQNHIDDSLTFKEQLILRLVSRSGREYYNYLSSPYKLPLYSLVIQIFGTNKEFLLIPENNKTSQGKHIKIAEQFSELFKDLLLSSLTSETDSINFNVEKWLNDHQGYLSLLDEILILPEGFDYEAAKTAVAAERKEAIRFSPNEYFIRNQAPKNLKMGLLVKNFKEATALQQKIEYAAKLLSEYFITPEKLHFTYQITSHLLRMLEPGLKLRLKKALCEIIPYGPYAIVQAFCIKELYKIEVALPSNLIDEAKASLAKQIRTLGISSSTTIQVFSASKKSDTGWSIAIAFKQESEAKSLLETLASIGIKAIKGRAKDSEEWSIQVKNYFPVEVINAISGAKASLNNKIKFSN